jgi:hypothetical protein
MVISRRLGIYETKGIPIKAKEKDEQRLRTKRVNNPTPGFAWVAILTLLRKGKKTQATTFPNTMKLLLTA